MNAEFPDVDVPVEFVKKGRLFCLSPRSIGQYIVADEYISFSARFQGMLRMFIFLTGQWWRFYETGDGIMFQEEAYYTEERLIKLELEQ